MTQTIEQRLALLEHDNAETNHEIATMKGQFEFISGQLRDVQRYMHNRFDQIVARFDKVEGEVRQGFGDLRRDMERGFEAVRRDLPKLAADAMREVLAERDRKP